jgi:hypothetical protein
MAIPTERSENVPFPRPLPRPTFFTLATWVAVCGFAYWNYFYAAGARISVPLSVGFWILALVVIPFVANRNREKFGGLVAATLALLGYVLLMQDALKR